MSRLNSRIVACVFATAIAAAAHAAVDPGYKPEIEAWRAKVENRCVPITAGYAAGRHELSPGDNTVGSGRTTGSSSHRARAGASRTINVGADKALKLAPASIPTHVATRSR
jgi:hypothetical protein